MSKPPLCLVCIDARTTSPSPAAAAPAAACVRTALLVLHSPAETSSPQLLCIAFNCIGIGGCKRACSAVQCFVFLLCAVQNLELVMKCSVFGLSALV